MKSKVSPFLDSIAPNDLQIRRNERYDGSSLSISLHEFAASDAEQIGQVYAEIRSIYRIWLDHHKDGTHPDLVDAILNLSRPSFFDTVHALGTDTLSQADETTSLRLGKALHDVKGGSLNSLLGLVQLLLEREKDETVVLKVVHLARDHAKIMRNIFKDLDEKTREEDEASQQHHIDHFVEKLHDFNFTFQELRLTIRLDCMYDGLISNCCLETSSIDRILYNYINNAAKYSADHEARVYIYPVNPDMIRWLFENPVSDDHLDWFRLEMDMDFDRLFLPKQTYRGQGFGFHTCAEIVCSSFGVFPPEKAVRMKYIGAAVHDQRFYSWFHWPALAEE